MKGILNLLKKVGTLKEKPRRGWVIHGIDNPETTAEHIFHTTFLVWIIGKRKDIDLERAIKMALIHDICEVYAPDITPSDTKGLSEENIERNEILHEKLNKGYPTTEQRKKMETIKKNLENDAMGKLLEGTEGDLEKEVWDLWNEYEGMVTPESKFVKQVDRIINLFQGLEYHKEYENIEYELWIKRAKEVIDDPDLLKLLEEIERDISEK